MNKIVFKKAGPYVLALTLFVILAYGFMPQILSDKRLVQSDVSSWEGMAQESREYNATHREPTLWTNSMFCGMPTVTISMPVKGNYLDPIYQFLFLGKRPASILVISMIGGFLLFLALGVGPYLAILGGIALTFCSYNMQIIQVGHINKMIAMAFMPWVLAAMAYAYRKNSWIGAVLFGFAMGFEVKANHVQITYYLALLIIFLVAAYAWVSVREKKAGRFIRTSCLLLVCGLLGIATYTNNLWPLYEYQQYTTRGGTELSTNDSHAAGGLEIDYATAWSYGPSETFNLLIPNYAGGSSSGRLGERSATCKFLKAQGYRTDKILKEMPLYWGPQPFTAGPMYMGAVLIFLFVLGLFLVKGPFKWALAAVSLLTVFLSWGAHFRWLTEFFFRFMPMYNKFRTVSMILVLLQITLPLLGIYVVHGLLDHRYCDKKVKNAFLWSTVLTAGFCLLHVIFPSIAGDFSSQVDGQLPAALLPSLLADRKALLRADAFRSFAFIVSASLCLWLSCRNKLKRSWAIGILTLLVLADFWTIDKRYLNDSHFVRSREYKQMFAKRPVDEIILRDPERYYRVLDLSVNIFNDAHISYYHKTVGGYSAAKLQRYQDMIDYKIWPEIEQLTRGLRQCKIYRDIYEVLKSLPVLSMLNTKYIVLNAQSEPIVNPYACGNAWWVDRVLWAGSADEEMAALDRMDLRHEAVLSWPKEAGPEWPQFREKTQNLSLAAGDTVYLSSYAPNELTYKASNSRDGVLVFSEVHYPKGWRAWVDDEEVPILRANYLLRALCLPAGEHEIRFHYLPRSYTMATVFSKISSSVLLILLAACIVSAIVFKKRFFVYLHP